MALITSKVEFLAMAKEYGLEEEHVAKLVSKGFDTIANFANGSDYVPGVSATSEAFVKDIVVPVLGSDDHPKKPVLRRL